MVQWQADRNSRNIKEISFYFKILWVASGICMFSRGGGKALYPEKNHRQHALVPGGTIQVKNCALVHLLLGNCMQHCFGAS
jgi:hypothetical protein